MYIVATTRFNEQTWKENLRWREKNNWNGCVYGTPKKVSETLTPQVPMFVLEMHNDKNKVKGVGLVKNAVVINQYHNIYTDRNYNRYTYKGKYRVDRSEMTHSEKIIMRTLDILLFTGSTHLKRGQGIIAIPSKLAHNKHIDFVAFFRSMFRMRFKDKTDTDTDTDRQEGNNKKYEI